MVSRLPTTTRNIDLSLGTWLPRLTVGYLALSLTGNPGVTGPVPSATLLAGGLVLLLSAFLLWQRSGKPFPRVSVVAGILCMCGLASCLKSPAPYLSSLGASALAGFFAVVLSLEMGVSSRSQWRLVAVLLSLVAVASAVHGLYDWQITGEAAPLKSTFTNPDCYSVIPLLGLFLALGLALEWSGRGRVLCALAVIPLVTALVLTAARAGLLALAVGYAGFLFTLACSRSQQLRTLAIKLFLIPTVIVLVVVGGGSNLQVVEKMTRLSRGNDPVAVKSRWDVVRHGYKTVLRSPVGGSGLGCFHLAYQQDRTALSAGEDYMNVAHNDYVQWFVEAGIPGGLSWLALLFMSLITAWRSYRSPTPWVAAQVGSTLGISTYCMLNFACPVPADLLWIGASFGLSGSLARLNQETAPAVWSPKVFPAALLLAAWGAWSIHWGLSCLSVQRAEREAAQFEAVLDWEGAVMRLQSAARLQPENFRLHFKLAQLSKKAFVFSGTDHWLDTQGQALLSAYQASPRDLPILLAQIRFLEDQQKPSEATQYVAIAESIAAYSPHVQNAKARNQIMLGQFKEAAATLAAMERTGKAVNDEALAILIYLLEAKGPTQGTNFLRKIGGQDPERAATLGLQAAATGIKLKEYNTALRLLTQVRYLATKRADVLLEIATTRGLAGDKSLELKTLDKLRRDPNVELDDAVSEKVWRRWSELQVDRGELDLVLAQLEDYLITHQRQTWPRVMMAQIYLRRDQKAEARAALREGIPYDTDGSLRIQLGDMCASQGLKELARSYYKEAMPVSPQRALIEERLKAMKSSPDELEEETLLQATPTP